MKFVRFPSELIFTQGLEHFHFHLNMDSNENVLAGVLLLNTYGWENIHNMEKNDNKTTFAGVLQRRCLKSWKNWLEVKNHTLLCHQCTGVQLNIKLESSNAIHDGYWCWFSVFFRLADYCCWVFCTCNTMEIFLFWCQQCLPGREWTPTATRRKEPKEGLWLNGLTMSSTARLPRCKRCKKMQTSEDCDI